MVKTLADYIRTNLRAVTQSFGAVIAFTYNESENTSSAAWRKRAVHPRVYKIINKVFFWHDDHCKESARNDVVSSIALLKVYGVDTNFLELPSELFDD